MLISIFLSTSGSTTGGVAVVAASGTGVATGVASVVATGVASVVATGVDIDSNVSAISAIPFVGSGVDATCATSVGAGVFSGATTTGATGVALTFIFSIKKSFFLNMCFTLRIRLFDCSLLIFVFSKSNKNDKFFSFFPSIAKSKAVFCWLFTKFTSMF